MSTSNRSPGVPNERARRQLFSMLQRVSSYTAWNRILGFYQAWVNVVKASVHEASERGLENETSLSHPTYVLLLKRLAHCDEGVRRLRQGDKRVFKYDNTYGEFAKARLSVSHWVTMQNRIADGENSLNPNTPLVPEFMAALDNLKAAWTECGPNVLEERDIDAAARTHYNDLLQARLNRLPVLDLLHAVPDPQKITLVATGQYIPYSGIWEPVNASAPKLSVKGLFQEPLPPEGPLKVTGTMGYLHEGTNAPQIRDPYNSPEKIDVVWRLLWRDDRYEDGTIPEVEKNYQFLDPETPTAAQPVKAPVAARPATRLSAYAATPCPQTGRWQAPRLDNRIEYIEQGQKMPGHSHAESGAVIWYLMPE